LQEKDYTKWFSLKATDKAIRNNQHKDIIERISRYAKYSLKAREREIEDWETWTFVRNAIVHTARRVSADLSQKWNNRYPSEGAPLNLTDKDLLKASLKPV